MKTRLCKFCGITKTGDHFYGKYEKTCKGCKNEFSKKYAMFRKNNPDYKPKKINKILSPHDYVLRLIQGSCKYKGQALDLSLADIGRLVYRPCFYCGMIDKREWKKGLFARINNLDRVDPLGAYTKNNCVSCCAMCNMMKKRMSVAEFIGHVGAIHRHNENK